MVALLDVNVLIALFDPAHVRHEAAHRWFAENYRQQWATCPISENAFVRILSNPAYPGGSTTAADAAARLRTFCETREHQFWPDSVSLLEDGRFRWNRLQGYRQVTDVYLLALAVSRDARLATFDSTISVGAVAGARAEHLELVAA